MVSFTHYGKIKAKERPRFNTRTGRVFTPKTTIDSENDIASSFKKQNPTHKPYKGLVVANILVGYQMRKSYSKKKQAELLLTPCDKGGDADNIIKSILDGLNGIAYIDDKQVCEIHFEKVYADRHSCQVEINLK